MALKKPRDGGGRDNADVVMALEWHEHEALSSAETLVKSGLLSLGWVDTRVQTVEKVLTGTVTLSKERDRAGESMTKQINLTQHSSSPVASDTKNTLRQ
ncbi:hypothetical protein E4U21_005090 [Claviceps maximensis]|nr:hypothetical protein E4U21_005090 [Claviceps maximensis]